MHIRKYFSKDNKLSKNGIPFSCPLISNSSFLSENPSSHPGESSGLKFIPNKSEIFRIISEFVSVPNSFIPI